MIVHTAGVLRFACSWSRPRARNVARIPGCRRRADLRPWTIRARGNVRCWTSPRRALRLSTGGHRRAAGQVHLRRRRRGRVHLAHVVLALRDTEAGVQFVETSASARGPVARQGARHPPGASPRAPPKPEVMQ
ncbi:hypothetical protein ACRAWD_08470 [Caulobacter segnis]